MLILNISKAQTAMQLTGMDCNGVMHDLYADLDAGKAVLIHFFMPNCSSCPPSAKRIQIMANNILASHPGMITAYALPYNNSTTCSYTSSWVSTNALSLYAPFDTGATQVAHYGGFGMPTVVLLGGADHRVMFSTQSFSTSDTTIMRDSIMAMLNSATGLNDLPNTVSSFEVFPNPANEYVNINLSLKESSTILMDITDINGKQVAVILDEKQSGLIKKQFNTSLFSNGNYFIRLSVNGKIVTQKLTIAH